MKSVIVAALTAAVLLLVFSVKPRGQTGTPNLGAPWQVGHCYRVILSERDTLNTFQVLGPATGNWLRVQAVPQSPPVPGGQPPAPLWINTNEPFAVQEWSCKG
jgi:hypothetical protein